MKQSKTTLKELTACYRAVLKHGILCNAIALGLIASPVMAETINVSAVPSGIHSIVGNTFGNNINGSLTLNLLGTPDAPLVVDGEDWFSGVYGTASLLDNGYTDMKTNYYSSGRIPTFFNPKQDVNDENWTSLITGDLNMTLNNTIIDRDVFGVFYRKGSGTVDTDIEMGVKGKTTVTLNNTVVKGDLRGGNGEGVEETDAPYLAGKAKLGDVEINVNNSVVQDEVVALGGYMSGGNVKINVTGNSYIGYRADEHNTRAIVQGGSELSDGWIIAGTQRNASNVESTEINLNTDGEIKVATDVNVGSRARYNSDGTPKSANPDIDSVRGNATLNMLGGGNIMIGGDARAHHVAGATTLNMSNINATVAGNVKEFQTINMDENSTLTAGTLTMTSNDALNVVLQDTNAYSKINVGTLDANGAKLNMLVRSAGDYNVVNATTTTTDFTYNLNNAVYDLTENNGRISAKAKSAANIARDSGINVDSAATVSALAQSDNEIAQQMSLIAQDAIARGDTDYVEREVSKMNPSKSPVATSVAMSVQNQVLSAAGERMSLPLTGRSGGDVNADFGVWAKGMYNRSKYRDLFTGNTWGTSVGFDTDLNHSVILGLGYSYSQTDVDLHAYDMDIDSNTIFVYGQYRNSDWFINGTIAYTMSKHEQNKTVFGLASHPSYHVNSLSEQIMSGYHFVNGITPTLGLRYLDVHADSYFDGLTNVSDVNSTYLTGVFGVDFKNAWIAPNTALFWNPELHAALTYDMVSDSDMAVVMIPGAAAYTVGSDNLSRVGGEFGIGLSAEYYYLTVSLNYDLNIHRDFTSQTGSVKVKYKF